jgi:hypothetical protein
MLFVTWLILVVMLVGWLCCSAGYAGWNYWLTMLTRWCFIPVPAILAGWLAMLTMWAGCIYVLFKQSIWQSMLDMLMAYWLLRLCLLAAYAESHVRLGKVAMLAVSL